MVEDREEWKRKWEEEKLKYDITYSFTNYMTYNKITWKKRRYNKQLFEYYNM